MEQFTQIINPANKVGKTMVFNEHEGHRTLELQNMQSFWGRMERDFSRPMVAKSVQYQTPQGTITVMVQTSDRKVNKATLIFNSVSILHFNQSNGTVHEHGSGLARSGEAQFCKSRMSVTYGIDCTFDKSSLDRINAFVKKHNNNYGPGVSWLIPGQYPSDTRFIVQKADGTSLMSNELLIAE